MKIIFGARLCDATGLARHRTLDQTQRLEQSSPLRKEIADLTANRTLQEWAGELERYGVPWAPVNSLMDVVKDPHFRQRDLFEDVLHDTGRTETHIRLPNRFTGYPAAALTPAPAPAPALALALGQHNRELLVQRRKQAK